METNLFTTSHVHITSLKFEEHPSPSIPLSEMAVFVSSLFQARRVPSVLILDDADHLDPASNELLQFMLRDCVQLLVVATARDELTKSYENSQTIRLKKLNRDHLKVMLDETLFLAGAEIQTIKGDAHTRRGSREFLR